MAVILDLAVWFGVHVIHPKGSIDWFAIALGGAALIAMLRWKLGVIPVVLAGGVLGFVYYVVRAAG